MKKRSPGGKETASALSTEVRNALSSNQSVGIESGNSKSMCLTVIVAGRAVGVSAESEVECVMVS